MVKFLCVASKPNYVTALMPDIRRQCVYMTWSCPGSSDIYCFQCVLTSWLSAAGLLDSWTYSRTHTPKMTNLILGQRASSWSHGPLEATQRILLSPVTVRKWSFTTAGWASSPKVGNSVAGPVAFIFISVNTRVALRSHARPRGSAAWPILS